MTPAQQSVSAEASPSRRARRWLLELGVVGLGYTLLSKWQTDGLLEAGTVAPAFKTRDVEGNPVSLGDYADKQVVLHFWATWCGVCRQEFGMLNALEQTLGAEPGRETILLSLVADDEPSRVRPFLLLNEIRYPVLFASRQMLEQYRVQAFPTTYYLTADSKVRDATVGMSSRLAMRAHIACT